jgi:hypothetical protein
MSDFYQDSAARRLQQIDAERQAALADLSAHRLNSDYDSAGQVIQQIANLDSERQNLVALHERYVAQNTPAPPEVLTPEELQNRPWYKLTAEQALQVATEGSKYGKGLTYADPNVQAGWRESQRRKSRGE